MSAPPPSPSIAARLGKALAGLAGLAILEHLSRKGRHAMSPASPDTGAPDAPEDGFISEGLASVAVAAVDRTRHPVASLGLTFRAEDAGASRRAQLAELARASARELSRRVH